MPINDRTEYKATDRHVFLVSVLLFIYYNYYYYYYLSFITKILGLFSLIHVAMRVLKG